MRTGILINLYINLSAVFLLLFIMDTVMTLLNSLL